jgi:LysM repeat protein
MKLKSLFRMLLILLATSLWLIVGIGVHAQTSCDDVAGNLLENCGFEEGFRSVAGATPRSVANDWQPWNAPRTNDMPTFQNTQPIYFASSVAGSQQPPAASRNREGGTEAQVYTSYFETHDAGIYQEVSGVEVGAEVRFSIYGYVFSSTQDELNVSENPGGVALRVGIDPTGGTDALADTVVYSDAAIFYDSFRQYSVITTAKSDTITVFVRTTVSEPVQYTHVYLDDAVLEVTPDSQPATATTAPSNTPVPKNTSVPPTATVASSNTPVPSATPINTVAPTQVAQESSPTPEGATATTVPSNTPAATATNQDVVPTATTIGATATTASQATATSRPANTPQAPISETFPGQILHTVQRGDTVGGLATRYGSSIEAIQQANDLDDSYLIFRGQGLIIPVRIVPATETPSPTPIVIVVTATAVPTTVAGGEPGTGGPVTTPNTGVYVVVPGDNLSGIARRFNTTVGTLVQLNGIANPNRIFVGQQLRLPGSTGGALPTPAPTTPPSATPVATQVTQPQATPVIIPTQTPSTPATYVVQPGDNLYRIAIRYNVSLTALGSANNISNYNLIFVGQVLQIPR